MMWGADTPLVLDALQIAAIASFVAGGAVFAVFRLRQKSQRGPEPRRKNNLEERVQVLERIAADRSVDLAEEIEQLRDQPHSEGAA